MIIETGPLGYPFKCQNPFVYTMHHVDLFPAGDGTGKPAVKRPIDPEEGDLDPSAAWRMYYGERVPGFPAHPHRGFETVTVVLQGTVDHTDGLGAKGRYADGDVQWMTAGKGLQHAEMFPLVKADTGNRMELFQIWLSLDSASRMVEPAYKMLWREDIPVFSSVSQNGAKTTVTVIAGTAEAHAAPAPAPDSWAADPANRLGIHLYALEPGAAYTLPAGSATMNRSLYFYAGDAIRVDGTECQEQCYLFIRPDRDAALENSGSETAHILLLEAEPIPEPIVAYGPYVMSSEAEIRQAFRDFDATAFGGWPFAEAEIYHAPDTERFAAYADGRTEYPGQHR